MKKIIVDTSLYIKWFRGEYLDLQEELLLNVPFLSSIVATELRAGARTKTQRRLLDSFLKPYEQTGRTISPSHEICLAAGEVIAFLAVPSHRILGDALIAMTARSIGAELWAVNKIDYENLLSAKAFKLRVIV
ncbi:MAG: PIN domain-containing protein [Planctomycetes bacterium]|nr:PIN domain-containing protein [Planctomycetota bacterium]